MKSSSNLFGCVVAIFVVSFFIQSCSSIPSATANALSAPGNLPWPQTSTEAVTTVCRINENINSYLGRTVRVRGEYSFDGMNYSFLRDHACSKENIIVFDLLYAKSREESVVNARKVANSSCDELTGFCNQSYLVDMRANVKLSSDGTLVLVAEHVFAIIPTNTDLAN